jgi:hypothetical protein
VRLVDLSPIGIPATDGGWGKMQVNRDQVLTLLAKLTELGKVPTVTVNPIGIPGPAEAFEVVFKAGSARIQ